MMGLPLWKINPEELINDKLDTKELSFQKIRNIRNLIQAYKEVSNKINEISKTINEQNFVDQLLRFYDLEAYLAELYFYLNEDVELLESEEDIIDLVNQDYILSYSYYLGDEEEQNKGSSPLIRMWLNREMPKAFVNKFII